MNTGFEKQSTEALVAMRERLVEAVMRVGEAIASGEHVSPETRVMVPFQAVTVEQLTAELFRRGVESPEAPWEEFL
jgi:hypothetical protein